MLYVNLSPPTYQDNDIDIKTELLFSEFKIRFGSYDSVAA
jgi:hypothetical protein